MENKWHYKWEPSNVGGAWCVIYSPNEKWPFGAYFFDEENALEYCEFKNKKEI